MSEVKRHSVTGYGYNDPEGEFVYYEDYAELQQKFGSLSNLCEEAMRINCEWEKSMMAAIAEDGIGSVTKAIEQLKADKHALQQKLDAMAAENAALKQIAMDYANLADSRLSEMTANCESDCRRECYELTNNLPANDAYLNSVRAESWADALIMVKSAIFTDSIDHIDFLFNGKIEQLRSGTHDTADKAG